MNDHLEVIGPSGEVTFFDLGAGTGVTNIGRSPSNTLALPSAGVADYAATLDHRAQPFTLLALTDASPVKVNGRVLRANESADLHEWDSIELDGYVLIVAPGEHMAGTATPAATTSAAPEGVPAVVPAVVPSNGSNGAVAAVAAGAVAAGAVAASTAPAALPATPTDGLTAAGGTVVGTPPSAMIANANLPTLGAPLPQRTDPLIYTTIEDRIQQVDVQVAAQWQFTFSNGSPLVSRFQLSVEGWVDPAWFGFDDNEFTLLERESRSVVLTAVAPRSPMSVAGAHHFVIVIKSDNLPGHEVRMPCTLVINPYYEYAIEPINPLEQTIPWRKRNATFVLPILNKGNSVAHYRIEGSDRENATRIEFPDEARLHLGAREIALNPTQELEVPILVTPFKRRLIGGGGRLYDVTVTTTPMEGVTGPLPTRAGLRHKPLFGRWVLVLLALLIAAALLWIFRPQVMAVRLTYENQAGQLETRLSNADQFAQGTGLLATIQERLGMAAANGSNGNGSGGNGSGGEAAGETEGGEGSGEGGAAPVLPNLASVSSALSTVGTTALADAVVRAGQPLTVTWETRNGSTVSLGFFGNTETSLVTVDNPASVRRGNFAFVPQPNINPDNTTRGPTIYELRVVNNILSRIPFIGAIGQVNRPLVVEVIPANAPVIQSFVVNTDTAVLGEQVTISWDVTMPNASDSLLLEQRQGDQVVATTPLSNSTGTMTLEPLANTQLRLVPETNLWIGTNPPTAATQNVSVLIPTPTPVPTPDIRAFQIEPQEVIAGNSITITYAISGSTISNLRFFGLPTPQIDLEFPQGRVAVPVPSPGPFNVALVAVRLPDGSTDPADPNAARVTAVASRVAVAPTPTPTPTFTLTPTPTPQVPVIEVLNLSPAEITRGDAAEVLLTWNVIGDMDTISISAPDFTLTSTEKQSSISVPRDATRVFVMTVMLDGEPAASKSVELKVNEPPPPTETPVPPTPVPPTVTPTATSTQVPDPLIISFNVTSDLPVTKEVGPDGNDIFHVAGGAEIIVSWEVQNASTVELRELSSTGDDRTLTKRLAKDQITVSALQDFTYIMTAYNNPADVDVTTAPRSQYGMASRTILVQLNAAQDFDPPTNVQWSRGGDPPGQDNESDPVIVTWEYNPAQTDSILGFRVYKAPAGSSAFVRIADERTLTNTTRTFTDETKPLCGQSYFIVAVYQDLTKPGSDKTVETDAGADSFITPGC